VERAWLDDDRKLRALVRFSKGQGASEVWEDVVDGIRRNISVGYDPQDAQLERTEGDLKYYRITRWEPCEVSIVSIPADPTVGVGRSLPENIVSEPALQGPVMSKENTTVVPDA
ncbi:HK97 family phage prohead protease, partial [Pseudomonas viridiflava]